MEQLREKKIDFDHARYELRDAIKCEMRQKNLSQNQLANLSGVDKVVISYTIGNNKNQHLIRIDVLDKITEGLGLPIGYFYRYMVGDLYSTKEHIVQAERVMEFTHRCLETGLHQHIPFKAIEDMIYFVRHNNKYKREQALQILDLCFQKGFREQLLPYYDMLSDSFIGRHEESKAHCAFRRFLILRDRSRKEGLTAMQQFLPLLPYVDGETKLEAYLRVITFAYSMNDWDVVLTYSRALEEIASDEIYYGKSLLYQSFAHREKGNMCQAFELTERYAAINDYFEKLAIANRMIIKIDMGDLQVIPELLQLSIESNRVYLDLPRLIEAYVKADRLSAIDELLETHASELIRLRLDQNELTKKYKAKFYYNYAIYLIKKGNIGIGLSEVLEGIKLFDQLNNEDGFRNAVLLFLDCYAFATSEQVEAFKNLFAERGVSCEKVFRIPLLDDQPVSG